MATRFFPPASSLHRDDYLEFAWRFRIGRADISYAVGGKENISQVVVAAKKNIAQVGATSPTIFNEYRQFT
ncbi:hypothetical protein [Microcoleus sp.]|uniref:hypothetical protein n=1 Tax=Microcoleus sp. TaxID=44472 RepID=UPI0035932AC7